MSDQGVLHTRGKTYGKVPELLMHDKTITDGAKITYAHMHWRFSQGANFESQTSMADYLGVSRQIIAKRIKELEAKDWVVVIERGRDQATKKLLSPIYHMFEHQGQCRQFRARYTCQEGESLRAKDVDTRERKSRAGIGGNPQLQNHVNSSSHGSHVNSSLHGNHVNSSSQYVLSTDSTNVDINTTAQDDAYEAIKTKWKSVVRSGMPTPNDLVGIQSDIQTYGHKWCMDALNGVNPGRPHTWNYIHSILEAWKKDGKPGEVGRVKYITEAMTVTETRRLEILMGTYTGVPQ